jgi:hypothetical protein
MALTWGFYGPGADIARILSPNQRWLMLTAGEDARRRDRAAPSRKKADALSPVKRPFAKAFH